MIKHYCEMCYEELPLDRLPHEESNAVYYEVLFSRSRSERNPKDNHHYGEVCDECVEHLLEVIDKLDKREVPPFEGDEPTP